MVDVNKLKSHPDKLLFTHVDGVRERVVRLIRGLEIPRLSELAAIFHDLGKINPNFQNKLSKKQSVGYSHHAYLSALAFYGFCLKGNNIKVVQGFLKDKLSQSDLIALIILIAKHHGHLPNFIPKGNIEYEPYIISQQEIKGLYDFNSNHLQQLPIKEFLQYYFKESADSEIVAILKEEKLKKAFYEKLQFKESENEVALEYFLNTQFSFALLILADKNDAGNSELIQSDRKEIEKFSKIYPKQIEQYISRFKSNTALNNLRTQIRKEAISNIDGYLKDNERIFELTSPTGSGKTIMLLALAAKIIENKGPLRILYSLPFLSITEQVEKEVLEIFKDYSEEHFIQRIDSKSNDDRFNDLQKELDKTPTIEKIAELEALSFQQQTFSYPFIITTFVQFFETLLSNKNGTLLKLPNFSNCIFLIDEIQVLPPRLYSFFVAYLSKFCQKFNSYAIVSTATQPNFNLQIKEEINSFFQEYKKPKQLLDHHKYFNDKVFNRYQIELKENTYDIQRLTAEIIKEDNSVLIILNTIDDSKLLFKSFLDERLNTEDVYLLNTHFIPEDRNKKIKIVKERLEKGLKTILVSTQLIEAGVDIDFPVLYRDFAPISSIVQSAGRCNRNGKLKFGKIILFNLKRNGKKRAELIYGLGKDKEILGFTKQALNKTHYEESQLLDVQKDFFDRISKELNFAQHSQEKGKLEFDFLKDIKECAYEKIGKFQLIDEQEYGIVNQYFVPKNDVDLRFENLLALNIEIQQLYKSQNKDWTQIRWLSLKLNSLLKEMSSRIVSVRLKKNDTPPLCQNNIDFNGIFKISLDSYSFERGVDVKGEDFIL